MARTDPRPGHRPPAAPRPATHAAEPPASERNAQPILLATRGSALALAQANAVLAQCREAFPDLEFEIKTIKTTGDELQTAAPAQPSDPLPKGLFTKELEVALLNHEADLAVHSLKDLPTDLPAGLKLGAVGRRADARDVLIFRDAAFAAGRTAPGKPATTHWAPGERENPGLPPHSGVGDLPAGATVATSSTRRKAQLLAVRPDLKVVEICGNVGTRLRKLVGQAAPDATILAAAGLARLRFRILANGRLSGQDAPDGLCATVLDPVEMLPCVGQGAVGIEVRESDARLAPICERLNHFNTMQCVLAERAFLAAMGGGCQSPVAAYAQILGHQIHLRAVSFQQEPPRRAEGRRLVKEAVDLGCQLAAALR